MPRLNKLELALAMRHKWIMGNWKMHGSVSMVTDLLTHLKNNTKPNEQRNTVVFPPAIYLSLVKELLGDSLIQFGAQNVYPKAEGAYTGEISGSMLSEAGCHFVLVGHSERRHIFAESEKIIAEKFHHAKVHGMIPVLCVGETLSQRQRGETNDVVEKQIASVVEDANTFENAIIAYEPVWAIGTGETATPEDAQCVHEHIRKQIAELNSNTANNISILYGGSVNEKNAANLFEMPDIDGGLVGGASLKAAQFLEIIKCIKSFY